MSRSKQRAKRRKPEPRSFVQVLRRPNVGVEVSTGRAWVGIDQQVGHGSADALFALTDDEYTAHLVDEWANATLLSECWSGKHPELLLFHPGGRSTRPENWHPARTRVISPLFAGELWRHIDALGTSADHEAFKLSQALAAGTARVTIGPDGVSAIELLLVGDTAYPRPAALIAGLDAGSTREQCRAVLGDPLEADPDAYPIEGAQVRLEFVDDGLAGIVVQEPTPAVAPEGPIGRFLAVLGEHEQGAAFQEVAQLAGKDYRRWAVSSGFPRRLLLFHGGIEMQVEDTRVLCVRTRFTATPDGPPYPRAEDLIPGLAWPPTRAEVHRVLGAPASTSAGHDLYRYDRRDLVIEYGDGSAGAHPRAMTSVLRDTSVSHGINRWRSGEFTLFLDVLGRQESHPLVQYVRGLSGVRMGFHRGVVADVEIGSRGYDSERFPAFVDGMPARPTRKDLLFGVPRYTGAHDDLRDFQQGWIHVHSADGVLITTITVSQDEPAGVDVRPWSWQRDRWR